MKDNVKELNLGNELPPEESAAIDRILSDFAEAENSEVDYASMLASIKAKARKENISVFSPAKKKKTVVRRVLTGVGAAAAVFVVGLAAFAVIKALPFPGMNGKNASGDWEAPSDHVIQTDSSGTNNLLPDPGKTDPGVKTETQDPGPDVIPVESQEPDLTEDAPAVLPTVFPFRGGFTGYAMLTDFLYEPTCSAQLVPDMLPEFMDFKLGDAELYAAAYGVEDGNEYTYICRVVDAPEEEFEVGVARFTQYETGRLTYLWHVCEGVYLEVEFEGFEREAAEELMFSLVLCDTEFVPVVPAPTEEAA